LVDDLNFQPLSFYMRLRVKMMALWRFFASAPAFMILYGGHFYATFEVKFQMKKKRYEK
jgi:hypothetical protein